MTLVHPDLARHVIAEEWLRGDSVSPALGSVTLRPHQLDAVRRIGLLLADAGGALLCDEVGLGKTYVALAIARSYRRALVVGPASIRDMWLAAAKKAGISIRYASTESLSRSRPARRDHDLVIVDEAHHFRTQTTARHRAVAELTARSPLLLISATPLHNRTADVTALLSLFLGSAARTLSGTATSHCIVRHGQSDAAGAFPLVRAPFHLRVPHESTLLELLLALPPPTPASDGGIAAAMVSHTLVRLWASSDAALREGLRRRLAKTVAIRHSLEAGRYPTRRELGAWTYGEASVQLGFAELLAPEHCDSCDGLLGAVREHERSLATLLQSLPRKSPADSARVEHLRALREKHAAAKIVAFSQFAETVAMMYGGLSRESGVAMLTSRGARIASGPITRREALDRFAPIACGAPAPKRGEHISLLVATDLLSEGVNLQDAAVVVHLDLPWTAATLEQRVGRAARLESRNREVLVYAIDPPAPGKTILRAEAIIRRKARLAETSVGASRIPPLFARTDAVARSEVEDVEAIRRALATWIEDRRSVCELRPAFAAVKADCAAVLALVTVRGRPRLIARRNGEMSAESRAVREIVEMARGDPAHVSPREVTRTAEQARQWIEIELASDDAGRARAGRSSLARPIGERLARHLARCPRHQRGQCSLRIAAIQRRLQAPFTLGIEREIEGALADATADGFLVTLERIIGAPRAAEQEGASEVRAVLILQRRVKAGETQVGERPVTR